jgi:anti-sigma factor RsiW
MWCADYEGLILEYCGGGLPAEQRRAVEAHLARCAECREFFQAQQRLDAALGESLSGLAPSPYLEQRILERVESEVERRRWVRSLILDTVGCAGVVVAALVAFSYVLAQPGVESALPQLGVYAAWAAAGLGCVYLLWTALTGKTGPSRY